MPSIVEYEVVLARMQQHQLRCQYYNSGAFNFEPGVASQFTGWIGPEDSTIRPAALERVQRIAPPYEATLARLAMRAWVELLPGPLWVMPKSQWAFELDFGSKAWMPGPLRAVGIDPALLAGRTNSPAIEFTVDELPLVTPLVEALLMNLLGSDFALGFPGYPVACTLHHHKQVWWITSDATLIEKLRALPGALSPVLGGEG